MLVTVYQVSEYTWWETAFRKKGSHGTFVGPLLLNILIYNLINEVPHLFIAFIAFIAVNCSFTAAKCLQREIDNQTGHNVELVNKYQINRKDEKKMI